MGFRPNRAVERVYTEAHWGIPPTRVWHVDDPPFLPDGALVQMGRLLELRVRDGRRASFQIQTPPSCHLAWRPDASERMYLVLTPKMHGWCRRVLWVPEGTLYELGEVAQEAGGRQARYPYPRLKVQVIGRCTNVIYKTKKKGDDCNIDFETGKVTGPGSEYIHRMGEEGGIPPYLCLHEEGRLLFAGGSYEVKPAGITR